MFCRLMSPVTAIPTQISHGPVAEAGIEFAEAQPRIIPLSELPEFATEQRNPGNTKHVTRIFVKLPSERLAEGVTFGDTPGLGSLAVAGAEETIAYLPRCDLGIVLINASAGLTQDDLVVVQALYQAGASAMVLISKADLFSATDGDQMISYLKKNVRDRLHLESAVHAVSVFGTESVLCDRWFENELRPFLTRHRELAITSRKRKAGALREVVIDALERRIKAGAPATAGLQEMAPSREATEALREGDRVLERAQGESFFLTRKIAKMPRSIIDVAAERIAAVLIESGNVDVSSIFSETLKGLIAEPVAATFRSIEQTRSALAKAVETAASAFAWTAPEQLPSPVGMPTLDVNEISQTIVIEKPRVLSLFGRSAVAAYVRRRLENGFDRILLEFLSLYANRLRRWMEQSINVLRNAFNEFSDMHRAHFDAAPAASDASEIEKDVWILREWNTADALPGIGK